MKRTICFCLVAILLSGCQALAPVVTQETALPPTQATITLAPSVTTVPTTTSLSDTVAPMVYDVGKLEEKGTGYIFSASYPVTGIDTIDAQVNATIREYLTMSVAMPSTPDQPGTVNVDVEVMRNDEIFAMLFKVTDYFSDSKASMTFYVTSVYHMPSATPIALSDLFIDGSGYLDRLYVETKEKIRSNDVDLPKDKTALSGIQWRAEGFDPVEPNYLHFSPNTDGLQLIFDNYQVAPDNEELGDVRVTIGWDLLEDILKPEWKDIVKK